MAVRHHEPTSYIAQLYVKRPAMSLVLLGTEFQAWLILHEWAFW